MPSVWSAVAKHRANSERSAAWAVAVPIEARSALVATFVTAHNYFPREALVEAIVLYVTEALGTQGGAQ